MLFSFALIFLGGIIIGNICQKLKIPALFGMIVLGIVIGPYGVKLLDTSILDISSILRKIALIIILSQAGLNLSLDSLKKVGRPAILMCFVPASFEIIGMIIFAPKIFGITILEAAILGTVIAAVSPAVVVPKMIKLMDEKYGTKEGIPEIIMAGASVDDIFVIVLFTSFTTLAKEGSFNVNSLLKIPTSIIFGIIFGCIIGYLIYKIFRIFNINKIYKLLIFMSISFILVTIEDNITGIIGFSGLLAIMSAGITLKKFDEFTAKELGSIYGNMWQAASILLFVLVGATVNINYALNSGLKSVILIFSVMIFRMLGVFISLLKTHLSNKEKLFCMLAYTPKATVQAAIGTIPLAMGLACGEVVLTVAVVAILVTAPFGAFMIDLTYKKLLDKENS